MNTSRRLSWLPNAITSIRLVASVPLAACILTGAWEWALWIYFAALTTDFFDGLAARKLGVASKFGENLDGLADTVLTGAALATLLLAGYIPLLGFLGVVAGGILFRIIRENPKKLKDLYALVPMFEVGCLFLSIVYIIWTLATLSYGWENWYLPATFVTLLVLATLKRNRLRLWCVAILPAKWRLPPQGV